MTVGGLVRGGVEGAILTVIAPGKTLDRETHISLR